MDEIDNDVVERALAGMQSCDPIDLRIGGDYLRLGGGGATLEAIARDPSLFRAIELRRAALQRDRVLAGGMKR